MISRSNRLNQTEKEPHARKADNKCNSEVGSETVKKSTSLNRYRQSIPRISQIAFRIPGNSRRHKITCRICRSKQYFFGVRVYFDLCVPKLPAEILFLADHFAPRPSFAIICRD